MPDLPKPICKYGYPDAQLDEILGDRRKEFGAWAGCITCAVCDGRAFNHEAGEYYDTGCGPHGVVTYTWDVEQFLAGGRNWD